MRGAILRGLNLADRNLTRIGLLTEPPRLRSFLFHGFFPTEDDVRKGLLLPQEGLTAARLFALIEHLRGAGYAFVTADDIATGLPRGRLAAITFDDGYANNLGALPILEACGVPATIFVTAGAVESGKRFWWDVVYTQRRGQGLSDRVILAEIAEITRMAGRVVRRVESIFGEAAFEPFSDLDRPLAPRELASLAAHPLVCIGNHTVDHPVLTELDDAAVRWQIREAGRKLHQWTGKWPASLAYPEGSFDTRVLGIARAVGVRCGFTTIPRAERLPIAGGRLDVGRYRVDPDRDIDEQLKIVRSKFQLVAYTRRLARSHSAVSCPSGRGSTRDRG